jgi:hypothetical protein
MTTILDTREEKKNWGGRIRWPPYTQHERSILETKFLGDWESLEFLKAFWNPIYDEEDLSQYRRTVDVWRMRQSGKTFGNIARGFRIDERKACALVSGKNLHPHLVQMYLNSQMLSKPRTRWKWILDCTPKPTNMFPKAVEVPERIQSYQDVLDFLKQFPPVPADHPATEFFGLSCQWVEQHKPELFGFLLGFLLGDAGKNYAEYEHRGRHYGKSTLSTNMAANESNTRILRYVQLCLSIVGIQSRQLESQRAIIRWVSNSTSLLTWIIRVCLGFDVNQRTSRNPVKMDWILRCPREFIIAFLQGIAESDGSVSKTGYYTAIASVPNSIFFKRILDTIGVPSRMHPKQEPSQLRINLSPSVNLPLFNPLIKSYRFLSMASHARSRNLLPPSPSFF